MTSSFATSLHLVSWSLHSGGSWPFPYFVGVSSIAAAEADVAPCGSTIRFSHKFHFGLWLFCLNLPNSDSKQVGCTDSFGCAGYSGLFSVDQEPSSLACSENHLCLRLWGWDSTSAVVMELAPGWFALVGSHIEWLGGLAGVGIHRLPCWRW